MKQSEREKQTEAGNFDMPRRLVEIDIKTVENTKKNGKRLSS